MRLLLLFILVNANLYAQNLVPNPSFELYTICPSNQDQVNNLTDWQSYYPSPDYFNSCSTSSSFSCPNNWGGYQYPASGLGYCALFTYASNIYGENIREFIGTSLTTSLAIGNKYFVSFKVSLSLSDTIGANCATNNIGALFSTIPFSISNPPPISNYSQIFSSSIITDTVSWTRIIGSFIADSAYQYITLGNFFNDTNTDTLIMNTSDICSAYYFIDDICVSTDSIYAINFTNSVIESLDFSGFSIYPNPVNDLLFFNFPSRIGNYNITFYNVIGQIIMTKSVYNEKSIIIDVRDLEENFILITIENNNSLLTYKLLKI